jgi:hypothetical protein
VVLSWRNHWDMIPECDLKVKAYHALRTFFEPKEAFLKAFLKAFGEGCRQASPNQEQEQEQEQEHNNNKAPGAVAVAVEKEPTEECRAIIASLVERGFPSAFAKQAVKDTDPALIREVCAYHADQKSLRSPVGSLRSMLKDPQSWGFERTENGWKRPGGIIPAGETKDQRDARIVRERADAQAAEAARKSRAANPQP